MKKNVTLTNVDTHVFTEYQLKLVKRNHEARYTKTKICDIYDVKKVLQHIIEREDMNLELREYYGCIFTNKMCVPIGYSISSIGSIVGVIANFRELLIQALLSNATGMIVFHNHPSGNPKASEADMKIQKELMQTAKLLNVEIVDNIIVLPDLNLHSTM